MRKKIVTCLICGLMVFGFVGCGSSQSSEPQEQVPKSETKEEVQNDTAQTMQIEYKGFNIVLPSYFELSSGSDLDSSYVLLEVAESDYSHYAVIDISDMTYDNCTEEDFKYDKKDIAYGIEDEDGFSNIESQDISIDGTNALFVTSDYTEDDEAVKYVVMLMYNPSTQQEVYIELIDYINISKESVIDDFKSAISQTTLIK